MNCILIANTIAKKNGNPNSKVALNPFITLNIELRFAITKQTENETIKSIKNCLNLILL